MPDTLIFRKCLPYIAFLLAASFLFFEMALQISPSVMVGELMRDIHLNAASLGFVTSVYYYSYTLMQIPAGLLFDHLNSRKLIAISVMLCVFGAIFFSMANTSYLAATGRFLIGLGSAFAFISVLFIASLWFPAKHFALLAGIAQLLAALGAMGGEGPLATVVEHLGWRNTMTSISAVGVILAVLIWCLLREPERSANNRSIERFQPKIWRNLSNIMSNSQTWIIALYSFAVWAPIVAFAALWGVPYLSTYYGVGREVAANACSMIWLGVGIGSVFIGWWSDRLGKRKLPLLICTALGLLVTTCLLYGPHLDLRLMYTMLFLLGFSSAGQALSFAAVKDNNHASVTGTAVGFNNMAVVAGGILFQPLVGVLLQYHSQGVMLNNMPIYSLADYRYALVVLPFCYLAGLACLLFMRETYCKNRYSNMLSADREASNSNIPALKAVNSGYE